VAALLADDPNDGEALLLLGLCDVALGRMQIALSEAQRAAELMPKDLRPSYLAGLLLFKLGDLKEAKSAFAESVRRRPDADRARAWMSRIDAIVSQERDPGPPPNPGAVESTIINWQDGPAAPLGQALARAESGESITPGNVVFAGHGRLTSFSGHLVLALAGLVASVGQPIALVGVLAVAAHTFVLRRGWRYTIHENRIDIQRGGITTKSLYIWMYEIEDVTLSRSPIQVLTSNATLTLTVDGRVDTRWWTPIVSPILEGWTAARIGSFKLPGVAKPAKVLELLGYLRDRALVDRRSMKNLWI